MVMPFDLLTCCTMNLSSLNALNASPGSASTAVKTQESGQARLDTSGRGMGDFSAYLMKALRPQADHLVDQMQRQGIADAAAQQQAGTSTGAASSHERSQRSKDTRDAQDSAQERLDDRETSAKAQMTSAARELAQRSRHPQTARWAASGTQAERSQHQTARGSAIASRPQGAADKTNRASDDEHRQAVDQDSERAEATTPGSGAYVSQSEMRSDNHSSEAASSGLQSDAGLRTLTLSSQVQIVTPQQGAVSEQSLQDFARAMGFSEAQLQQLLGNPASAASAPNDNAVDILMTGNAGPAGAGQAQLLNALNQALPAGFRIEDLQLSVVSARSNTLPGLSTDGPSTLSVLGMMEAQLESNALEATSSGEGGSLSDGTSGESAFGQSGAGPAAGTRANASTSAPPAGATHTHTAETYEKLSNRLATEMAARMNEQISQGEWKMKFALKPANLGTVDVQLEMRDGKLAAVLQADNPLTQDLLQNGSQRLRDALNQMGLTQSSVQFGLGQGQGQRGERDTAQARPTSVGRAGTDTADNATVQLASAPRRHSLSQLDFYA